MTREIIDRENPHSENPLDEGWVLVRNEDGSYELEVCDPYMNADYLQPWMPVTVYRVPVPDDVYAEHNWVNAVTDEERAQGRSPDVRVRAEQLAAIAMHHGWIELDQYPLTLSAEEVTKRYGTDSFLEAVAEDGIYDKGQGREGAVDAMFEGLARARCASADPCEVFSEAAARMRATDDYTGEKSLDAQIVAHTLHEKLSQVIGAIPETDGLRVLVVDKAGTTVEILVGQQGRSWTRGDVAEVKDYL